ncbi:MAG: sigma-70 family RNA polymerase sigma factor [Oscillospiraceae bacterium]|nr:sigma-70 family RNA polymerase sigma factor [Oscillospiraceae bacterium]
MARLEEFDALYKKYRNLMFRVAFDILGNVCDTEDALQDAFMCIAENMDRISAVDCPQTRNFAVIITRNICFNMLRKKRVQIEIDEDAPSDESVEEEIFSDMGVEILERALKRLPQNYRDILYLTAYEELSLHAAADILGITYENAKSRVQRARKKLSEILKEEGYE